MDSAICAISAISALKFEAVSGVTGTAIRQ